MKALLALLLLPFAAFAQTTVTCGENTGDDLTGFEETELTEESPTTNSGSDTPLYLSGFSAATQRHAIFRCTGLASLPDDANVTAASLELRMTNAGGGPVEVTLYRLRRAPVEAQATWTDYITSTAWTTGGAADTTNDRFSSSLGVTTGVGGSAGYFSISQDDAAFMTVLEDIAAGNGNEWFLLEVTVGGGGTYEQYVTSEGTDTQRPYFELTYTTGGASGLLLRRRRS
jgi:hypothetical protein